MRRFLNNRLSNYNNVGGKVDDFCEDCENRWLPFSRVWWDSTEKNIANIKRKDNGIFVIKKILSLINSISESIKDIYDRINVIEPPILSEKLIELENDYLEVGVTADDKQEDLNIAIYENYINLKNTKVDKPLIESTSDSLKIVALDNQGESVFIKSSEVGKVKSVNNKIGDVILKTSDLENDSDYTTNLKLNQERDERISGDNLKLDKPTTSGTTTTHPNIVGVDDLGNSAKLKASDFGKVKSVNGKEGDVILKTSDLENDSDYTTNATLTAHTSNKSNPHNVTKSQIGLGNVDNTSDLNKPISTATQTELNKKLDKPTTNNTPEYVLLADGSTAPKSEFGKVDKVMGVDPDNNKNVDISGVAMNWTNANQRFSGLVDKSADATYNNLLGVDSNGYTAKVGLLAITNEMSKATDAQKDAWRLASLKTNETYSITAPVISAVTPFKIERLNQIYNMTCLGSGLHVNPDTATIKIVNIDTGIEYDVLNNNIQVYLQEKNLLNFQLNPTKLGLPFGTYKVILNNNGAINMDSNYFSVVEELENISNQNLDIRQYSTNGIPNPKSVMYSSGADIYGRVIDGSIESYISGRPILTGLQASGDFEIEIDLFTDRHYYAWNNFYAGITTLIGDESTYYRNMVEYGINYGGRYYTKIIPENTTAPSGEDYSYSLIIVKRGLNVVQYLRCLNTNSLTISSRVLTSNINRDIHLVVNSQTSAPVAGFDPTNSNLKLNLKRVNI